MQDDLLADLDPDLIALVLDQTGETSIAKIDENTAPLSFLQNGIWSLQTISPDSTAYNMPVIFKVNNGLIDNDRLLSAFHALIEKHEAFRTYFSAGTPNIQHICDSVEFDIEVTDVEDCQNYLESNSFHNWLNRPFSLSQAPLLRGRLITDANTEQIFVVNYHHLISDGWSNGIILQDLKAAYSGEQLSPNDIRFIDYITWQNEQLSKDNKIIDQWQAYLQDHLVPLDLPILDNYGTGLDHRGHRVSHELTAQQVEQLQVFCKTHQLTPFAVTQAVWQIVLTRYNSHRKFSLAVPSAARNHEQIQKIVGCFITTQAYRCEALPQSSLLDIANAIQRHALFCMDEKQLPFEFIMSCINPRRVEGRSNIFQVGFDCQQRADVLSVKFDDFSLSPIPAPAYYSKYELGMVVQLAPKGGLIELEYRTALFSESWIEYLLCEYIELLFTLIKQADETLSRVLENRVDYPAQTTTRKIINQNVSAEQISLSALFAKIVQLHSEHIALVHGKETLTYTQLAKQVTQLAGYLALQGIGCDDRVALLYERDNWAVISMLAAWQLGAAYVPLDPSSPTKRVKGIVRQSGAKLVLGSRELLLKHDIAGIDPSTLNFRALNDSCSFAKVHEDALAYVIYTSGTTGQPKGVCVSQKALSSHLQSVCKRYQYSKDDRCLVSVSMTFDASIEQIFGPLLSGATLVIDEVRYLTATQLCEFTERLNINVFGTTPAYLRYLSQFPDNIRLCIVGGEAWLQNNYQRLSEQHPSTCFVNAYGPSETVITPVAWLSVEHEKVTSHYVPLGEAIGNRQLFILDDALNPVPNGVVGELYISGIAMARGYLEQPKLTASYFIANPFSGSGERLYRTGDLVRFNNANELEFISRLDNQVKVRGYRIELGELEAQLTSISNISGAYVVLNTSKDEDIEILAYVQAENITPGFVMTQLQQVLPQYMIPDEVIVLDQLPLTPNGKVDREGLPKPKAKASVELSFDNETQYALATLWQETLPTIVLEKEKSLLSMGGDSISALRLASRINEFWQVNISVNLIFTHSFFQLAELIADECLNSTTSKISLPLIVRGDHVTQRLSDEQRSLWLVDRMSLSTGSAAYNIAGGVEIKGSLNIQALNDAFVQVISRHQVLRSRFESKDGDVNLVVDDTVNFAIEVEHIETEGSLQIAATRYDEFVNQTFSLESDLLIRGKLLVLDVDHFHMLVSMHHIVSDGWSVANLVNELGIIYTNTTTDTHHQLPHLPVQYSDYSYWQHQRMVSQEGQDVIRYWQQMMEGAPETTLIPLNYPRSELLSSEGDKVSFTINEVMTETLKKLSADAQVSIFSLLLTSYYVALAETTGQQDLVLGTDLSGREKRELEPLIGFFIKVLPIRLKLDKQFSFVQTAKQVQSNLLTLQENQLLTLDSVLKTSDVVRKANIPPLFQQLFVMQNIPKPKWPDKNMTVSELLNSSQHSKFDSAVFISPSINEYLGHFVFKKALYRAEHIQTFVQRWLMLLDILLNKPHEALDNNMNLLRTKHTSVKKKSSKFLKLKK